MKSDFLSKLRSIVFISIFLILISGCSGGAGDDSGVRALKDETGTCATVRGQVATFASTLGSLEEYYKWESFKLLTGTEQRADMKEKILSVAPFLAEPKFANLPYISGAQGSKNEFYGDSDKELDLLEFFFKKTEGALLSPEDRDAYLNGDWLEEDNYIGPIVASIFGSFFGSPTIGNPTSDPGVCGTDYDWDFWNEKILWAYDDALEVLEWVKDCEEETYGACSSKKYVSSGDTTVDTSCASLKLSITVNDNEPGISCGKLSFSIFQADKNTGDCLALGYWNDRNGSEQVGAFFECGLEEGMRYTATVRVGNDYTYTNNFGSKKTVLSFSIDQLEAKGDQGYVENKNIYKKIPNYIVNYFGWSPPDVLWGQR